MYVAESIWFTLVIVMSRRDQYSAVDQCMHQTVNQTTTDKHYCLTLWRQSEIVLEALSYNDADCTERIL